MSSPLETLKKTELPMLGVNIPHNGVVKMVSNLKQQMPKNVKEDPSDSELNLYAEAMSMLESQIAEMKGKIHKTASNLRSNEELIRALEDKKRRFNMAFRMKKENFQDKETTTLVQERQESVSGMSKESFKYPKILPIYSSESGTTIKSIDSNEGKNLKLVKKSPEKTEYEKQLDEVYKTFELHPKIEKKVNAKGYEWHAKNEQLEIKPGVFIPVMPSFSLDVNLKMPKVFFVKEEYPDRKESNGEGKNVPLRVVELKICDTGIKIENSFLEYQTDSLKSFFTKVETDIMPMDVQLSEFSVMFKVIDGRTNPPAFPETPGGDRPGGGHGVTITELPDDESQLPQAARLTQQIRQSKEQERDMRRSHPKEVEDPECTDFYEQRTTYDTPQHPGVKNGGVYSENEGPDPRGAPGGGFYCTKEAMERCRLSQGVKQGKSPTEPDKYTPSQAAEYPTSREAKYYEQKEARNDYQGAGEANEYCTTEMAGDYVSGAPKAYPPAGARDNYDAIPPGVTAGPDVIGPSDKYQVRTLDNHPAEMEGVYMRPDHTAAADIQENYQGKRLPDNREAGSPANYPPGANTRDVYEPSTPQNGQSSRPSSKDAAHEEGNLLRVVCEHGKPCNRCQQISQLGENEYWINDLQPHRSQPTLDYLGTDPIDNTEEKITPEAEVDLRREVVENRHRLHPKDVPVDGRSRDRNMPSQGRGTDQVREYQRSGERDAGDMDTKRAARGPCEAEDDLRCEVYDELEQLEGQRKAPNQEAGADMSYAPRSQGKTVQGPIQPQRSFEGKRQDIDYRSVPPRSRSIDFEIESKRYAKQRPPIPEQDWKNWDRGIPGKAFEGYDYRDPYYGQRRCTGERCDPRYREYPVETRRFMGDVPMRECRLDPTGVVCREPVDPYMSGPRDMRPYEPSPRVERGPVKVPLREEITKIEKTIEKKEEIKKEEPKDHLKTTIENLQGIVPAGRPLNLTVYGGPVTTMNVIKNKSDDKKNSDDESDFSFKDWIMEKEKLGLNKIGGDRSIASFITDEKNVLQSEYQATYNTMAQGMLKRHQAMEETRMAEKQMEMRKKYKEYRKQKERERLNQKRQRHEYDMDVDRDQSEFIQLNQKSSDSQTLLIFKDKESHKNYLMYVRPEETLRSIWDVLHKFGLNYKTLTPEIFVDKMEPDGPKKAIENISGRNEMSTSRINENDSKRSLTMAREANFVDQDDCYEVVEKEEFSANLSTND